MIPVSLDVVNMSHVTSGFAIRDDDKAAHYTQYHLRPIKLYLVFLIPGEESSEVGLKDPFEQDPENIPRFAFVRVPKGVPVFRLRALIVHCENELQEIYGFRRVKRADWVFTGDDTTNNFKYEFILPMSGVVYV